MSRHHSGTWLGRSVRGMWPDHNPLRRRYDRAAATITAGLVTAFLVGTPAAAFAAGNWVHANGLRTQRAEELTRHQTHAVLLGSPRPAKCGASMAARWSAPDGTTRIGKITAMAGPMAGNAVMVWTNNSGRLTGPPLRHAVIVDRATLAAILAPLVIVLLLLSAAILAHRALNRRRLAAWEADWSATEPRWTRRP